MFLTSILKMAAAGAGGSAVSGEIRAAGLIIFRLVPKKIEYLLLQAHNLDHGWTPPKGKLESGETPLIAAQRETKEETGLSPEDYDIIPGFESKLEYTAWGKHKTVNYWVAKLKDNSKSIVISPEHIAYNWFDLPQLLKTSDKENMKQQFVKCDKFLHDKYFPNK